MASTSSMPPRNGWLRTADIEMDPLVAVIIVLVLLWFGGVTFGYGMPLLHLLLVVVLILAVVRLVQGRNQ